MKTMLALTTLLLSPGIAFASDTTGQIRAIDAKKHTVTMAYDDTYTFDPKVDLSKFKVGQKVIITFSVKGKASAIAGAP